jgi:hypothetical protein
MMGSVVIVLEVIGGFSVCDSKTRDCVTKSRNQESESRMQDAGCRMQDAGCRMQWSGSNDPGAAQTASHRAFQRGGIVAFRVIARRQQAEKSRSGSCTLNERQ